MSSDYGICMLGKIHPVLILLEVCRISKNYHCVCSLPQWLVVPQAILDWQLGDAARHFRGSRPPIWCWGSSQGAALVRMADIHPTITERYVVVVLYC